MGCANVYTRWIKFRNYNYKQYAERCDERIVLWSENMNEWIVARINSLKEDLSKKQEYFKINIQNMDSPTYEDNTINDLLVMKKLKTEIEQLELLLQLNGIFAQDNAM